MHLISTLVNYGFMTLIKLDEVLLSKIKTLVQKSMLTTSGCRIFIFGSRVKLNSISDNNFRLKSDIDIGIIAKDKISAKDLFLFYDQLESLPTLLKFDVVDFSDVSEDFKNEALKNIHFLN